MGVDIVVRRAAVDMAANQIGQFTNGVQVDLGFKQQFPLCRRKPLAGAHFIADLVECRLWICVDYRHGTILSTNRVIVNASVS